MFFLYSKLIFPLDPNDSVLLEIPVIISQGVSQKYRLALDDLIYVEACQHRLILHTIQGDFTTRCTFADLTVCLTPSDRFFHGGKGLLINFAHVSLVQVTGEVLLKNGQIIFCSRRRRRETWKPSWSTPEQESFPTKRYKKTGGLPARRKISTKYRFCSVFASCDSLSC